MATPRWLQEIACCVVGRGCDDDCEPEVEVASKPVIEEPQEWYPFLLGRLSLRSDTIVGKAWGQEPRSCWEPAEEPSPALNCTSSNFARCAVARKSARRGSGSPQNRLQKAISTFRTVEACDELDMLECSGGGDSLQQLKLDAPTLERIRRIGNSSLEHLRWWSEVGSSNGLVGGSWPIKGHNDALMLDWGFRLEDGLIHATFSTEVRNSDIPTAVAAFCELQLYGAFNDDFVEASALEQNGAANDSIWHLITHNKVLDVRADNIWQVTVTDALEEPLGAIIVDLCTPEQEGLTELRGTALPHKREGFTRQLYGHSTYFLFPTAQGIGQEASFRLVNYSVTRPVPKLAYILGAMPNFAASRILRVGAERACTRLKQHLTMSNDSALDSAMRTSPQTSVYEAIREHLAAMQVSQDNLNEQEERLRFYSFDDDLDLEAFTASIS